MKIQTFKNKKGLMYGTDAMRISCDKSGTLRIGSVEVSISAESESIMPVLFNGSSGVYKATFTDSKGVVYELANVTVRGGRVIPPPPTEVEFMELRYRLDEVEAKYEALCEDFDELSRRFDTNSLNFLIN